MVRLNGLPDMHLRKQTCEASSTYKLFLRNARQSVEARSVHEGQLNKRVRKDEIAEFSEILSDGDEAKSPRSDFTKHCMQMSRSPHSFQAGLTNDRSATALPKSSTSPVTISGTPSWQPRESARWDDWESTSELSRGQS